MTAYAENPKALTQKLLELYKLIHQGHRTHKRDTYYISCILYAGNGHLETKMKNNIFYSNFKKNELGTNQTKHIQDLHA